MNFILIISLFLYGSVYGSDAVELNQAILETLVSGKKAYFTDTAHCIDQHGQDLCAQLKSLDAFASETIEHCKDYMQTAQEDWRSQFPEKEVPFFSDIDAISTIFDECFGDIPLPLFKDLHKGCYLLRMCDNMSLAFERDQGVLNLKKQYIPKAPYSAECCKKDLMSVRISLHNNTFKDRSARALMPDFMKERMGEGMEIKYRYTSTGIFSLLDYMACLQQGIILLEVQKPQKNSHLSSVHRGGAHGISEVFMHDVGHLSIVAAAFRALEEGFEKVKPGIPNYKLFMDIVCNHLSSVPSSIQKAQSLVVFFGKLHESVPVSLLGFEKFENQLLLHFTFGEKEDKSVFTELVLPLCTKEQTASLKEEEECENILLQTDVVAENDHFLRNILKSWHEREFATLSSKLAVFQAKQYQRGSVQTMPWGCCMLTESFAFKVTKESFSMSPSAVTSTAHTF